VADKGSDTVPVAAITNATVCYRLTTTFTGSPTREFPLERLVTSFINHVALHMIASIVCYKFSC
jgi:hypothetical protein